MVATFDSAGPDRGESHAKYHPPTPGSSPPSPNTTVKLKVVSVGTEVDIEQEGIPDVIPPEACYLGWHDSLHKLEKLVVPEINQ